MFALWVLYIYTLRAVVQGSVHTTASHSLALCELHTTSFSNGGSYFINRDSNANFTIGTESKGIFLSRNYRIDPCLLIFH